MKKFVLALLAVVLVLGLSAVAFADECPRDNGHLIYIKEVPATCYADGYSGAYCNSCDSWIKPGGELTSKVTEASEYKELKVRPDHVFNKKKDTNENQSHKDCTVGYTEKIWCSNPGCTEYIVDEIPAAAAHDFANGKVLEVVVEGTCNTKRVEKRQCKNCDVIKNDYTFTAEKHDYLPVKVYGLTAGNGIGNICTENVVDTWKCSKCGDVQAHYQYEIVMKGEQIVEIAAFGSAKGVVVNNKAQGHLWSAEEVVEPVTCFEDGLNKKTCTRPGCGEIAWVTKECKGHKWGAWTVIAEPRCEEDGLKVRYCTVCVDVDLDDFVRETAVIPKLGHNVKLADETKAATCTEAGYTKGRCIACEQPVTTPIDPLGHAYGEWTVKDGLRYKVCANCNDIVVETVAPVVPETPADPEDKPSSGNGGSSNTGNGGSSSTGSGSDASIPATGDNTSNVPYIMMVAAVAGLVVLVASKRKVNC